MMKRTPARTRGGLDSAISACALLSIALMLMTGAVGSAAAQFKLQGEEVGEAEWQQFHDRICSLLQAYRVPAEQSWSSSEGQRDWYIRMLDTYQRNGLDCATVETRIRRQTSGQVTVFQNPYCRDIDGRWKMAE